MTEELKATLARLKSKQTKATVGVDLAKAFENACNCYGDNDMVKAFVDQITHRTHRTGQQAIMKVVVALIEGWSVSHDNGNYDGRNQATVELCKRLTEYMNDDTGEGVYLPCV